MTEILALRDALAGGGHDVTLFAVDDPSVLSRFLDQNKPDLIFNRCEEFLDNADLEMNVAATFELFKARYTGSPAPTLAIALDKGITKAILQAHGIPTAAYAVISNPSEIPVALEKRRRDSRVPRSNTAPVFPMIVKPVREDGSLGIDVHAVVHNCDELEQRVSFVHRQFRQPAIVEEFIEGREVNIGVLAREPGEFETLPIAEIIFDRLPSGIPKIVGYEAKWLVNSPCDLGTVPRCPADIAPALARRLRELAVRSAHAIGIADYGRIDMRIRSDGRPFVLEVNPNPDLSREGGFMRAAKASGRTYTDTVLEIVEKAKARLGIIAS
jgi:D-alanine-D-alanine ligase